METYRLNSRLLEGNTELEVRTANDSGSGVVSSLLYVNGELKDTLEFTGCAGVSSDEEALSLVRKRHEDVKREIEALFRARRSILDSGDAQAMCDMGLAFLYRRLCDEAQELFRAAVQVTPDAHQALDLLSRVEVLRGNHAAAIDCARQAVQQQPTYPDYRNTLGEAMMAAGMFQAAVKELEEAISINIYYADAHFNLGLALLENAVRKEAPELFADVLSRCADCFTKAAMIFPHYLQSEMDAAMRALQDADLQRALELMKEVQADKRERHRREFAPLYARFVETSAGSWSNRLAERIEKLEEQLAKNPTYVDLCADLARCYVEQSRLNWQQALKQYGRALEMNPSWEQLRRQAAEAERQYPEICAAVDRIRAVR